VCKYLRRYREQKSHGLYGTAVDGVAMRQIKLNWLNREHHIRFFVPSPEKLVNDDTPKMSEEQLENVKRILEEFIDMGVMHYFKLQSGGACQGYAVEVEGCNLLMWDSGPMAAEEQFKVPITEIDLNTLSYLDEERRAWIEARWDEKEKKWTYPNFQ
jgi:hypothetical protein